VSRSGQVNYTEAEEILQDQPVMAGVFTINSHPALVLFDSGASHSFMSMGFVKRHNLPIMAIPKAYRISTPGAKMFINTRTDTVSLVLATHSYRLQFMLLPGHGIDAIVGMNWLKVYGVVLDLKRRVVELRLPASKDRMSLPIPSELTSPVAARQLLQMWKSLLISPLFQWSVSFRMFFLMICLGYHRIEMWSSLLS
jgi:hypothetical protein